MMSEHIAIAGGHWQTAARAAANAVELTHKGISHCFQSPRKSRTLLSPASKVQENLRLWIACFTHALAAEIAF